MIPRREAVIGLEDGGNGHVNTRRLRDGPARKTRRRGQQCGCTCERNHLLCLLRGDAPYDVIALAGTESVANSAKDLDPQQLTSAASAARSGSDGLNRARKN
ncbi:hypothetical protein VTN96DRAFT_5163 [Rasamsonia emersonii]